MRLDLEKKSNKNIRHLVLKCKRSLRCLGFSDEEVEGKIIGWRYLKENKIYRSNVDFFKNKYEEDSVFRDHCLETSRSVISGKTALITPERLNIAANYIIGELPLMLNGAEILGREESLFCYRDCFPFVEDIYKKGDDFVSKRQGYLVVDIKESSHDCAG